MTSDQIQILRDRVNLLIGLASELNEELQEAQTGELAASDHRPVPEVVKNILETHDNNFMLIDAHSQQIMSAIDALATEHQ